jgi:hypothetical protein
MPESSGIHRDVAVSITRNRTRLSHWWDVSTGCPVLAGAFCSMALMFNVCALVKEWQHIVLDDGSVFELHTPSWLRHFTPISKVI